MFAEAKFARRSFGEYMWEQKMTGKSQAGPWESYLLHMELLFLCFMNLEYAYDSFLEKNVKHFDAFLKTHV